MTKSELQKLLAEKQPNIPCKVIDDAIREIFDQMVHALSNGQRIEIRGFGSFSLRHRAPRIARNPKTGAKVTTPSRFAVHFKPGKELKDRVNTQSISSCD